MAYRWLFSTRTIRIFALSHGLCTKKRSYFIYSALRNYRADGTRSTSSMGSTVDDKWPANRSCTSTDLQTPNNPKTCKRSCRILHFHFTFHRNLFHLSFQVLCFHLGMTERFLWDCQTPQQKVAGRDESRQIASEIHNEIAIKNRDLIYTHEVDDNDTI